MNLATLELGGRQAGPHVLITGGVHGDEFEPMAALRQLAGILEPLEIRGRITLVPIVNESAFRLGQREGDDGLDLARTCPGRANGSTTERTAHALSTLIRSADAYIDLHTGGAKLTVQPLTGYMLHPRQSVLDRQRRMARAFGLPIIWGTDPSLDGRSLSIARDADIPAIYAEYLGGGGCDPAGVAAYVQGCLNVLTDMNLIDLDLERFPELASSPAHIEPLVVEDLRTGSGHMQVQHPSPRDGLFEPAVRLGQTVHRGDLLGHVSDILGHEPTTRPVPIPVPVDRTGLVLVLRHFALVKAGDSLGVVLETDPLARA